jgi:hypothetical protein
MNDIVTKAEADRAGMDDRIMVTVQTPAPPTLVLPAEMALAAAKAFVVDSQEAVEIATGEAQSAKRHWDRVEEQRKLLKNPIDEAAKRVQELFRHPLETWLAAGRVYKEKIGAFVTEQARVAAIAQAKADEAARKERARLEAEAAKAEAAGKTEVAEAKRVALDELEMAPTVIQAPEKVDGLSVATTYDAELVNMLDLVKFIVRNPMYLNLLTIDTANVRRLAQSLRDQFVIPGLKLVKRSQTRIRK